jgi:membrane-bound lytic murein transglycosylase D
MMNLTRNATTSILATVALLAMMALPGSNAAARQVETSDPAPAPSATTTSPSAVVNTSPSVAVISGPTELPPAPVSLQLAPVAPVVAHYTSISKDPSPAQGAGLLAKSPFVHSEPHAAMPFPLLLNQAVRNYVDDLVDQPKGLELAFQRSRPFMSEMIKVLKAEGVPDDLVYLTFAESDFSKKGQGPWQFTADTAARFGLRVNRWLDERRDPILSTRAAAEYLAELHDQADNDWRVALIGWNTGEGNLERYWLLEGANYEKFADRLPRRTRQLVNRFMAVAFIAHNSATYGIGGAEYSEDEPDWTTYRFKGGTLLSSIARKFETSVSKLRELNPALRADRVPPNERTYAIRVPGIDDDSY